MITLFVGIAASSAFQKSLDTELRPGQTVSVGGYQLTYERPTSGVVAASNGRLERIDLGAVMRVRRDGKEVQTLTTKRSYFPTMDPTLGPISRFFEGEATSEVGLRAGLLRDVWTVISPSLSGLQSRIDEGDKVFEGPGAKLDARQRQIFLAQALAGLASSYRDNPPPATFRTIISPMVTWIWLGAIIVFLGGLITLWPAPRTSQRMVTAGYAARVARELGRA
jgi:cytochrome c-type biogenesis protein CcmF